MANRGEEHHGVVHASGQHAADEDPKRAGHVAELRGEHRSQERTGRGDGREMVAEENEFVGFDVVDAVGHLDRRSDPVGFHPKHLSDKEQAVKAIADGKETDRGEDQGQGVH